MARRGRALTFGAVLLCTGCGEWPRFANRPDLSDVAEAVPDGLPAFGEVLAEAGDWPGTPMGLGGSPSHPLGPVWEVTPITGTLSPWGVLGAGAAAFGCPDAVEVAGSYQGDVDFVRLRTNLGARLCLLLDAPPGDEVATAGEPAPTAWDLLLYRYDPDSSCITGDFLTMPAIDDPEQPGWTEPGGRMWVDWADPGDLALYVTGASGSYGSAPDWTVYVVPVATWESCEALDVQALRAELLRGSER